jgi:transcription elongation factor Elf1
MNPSESARVDCPYCGESFGVTVDVSVGRQDYIEDCQVCCRPIQFRVRVNVDGTSSIDVRGEDD